MKILLCYPGHTVSTVDVAIGWHKALRKLGHETYHLAYEYNVPFYGAVLSAWEEWNADFHPTLNDTLWLASQDLVCKAVELLPLDMVVLVNGMLVHERGYQLLNQLKVPVVVIHTEAPYNDFLIEPMLGYMDLLFINDRASLERFQGKVRSVFYLPHSYDPERHHLPNGAEAAGKNLPDVRKNVREGEQREEPPGGQKEPPGGQEGYRHQVFFLGSMYEERKALFRQLEEIDLGCEVQLDIYATSMDGRGRLTGGMQNDELVRHYWGSDIVLSPNRTTADYQQKTQITDPAWSLGPRVYEVAACGTFQLTDDGRPELREVFGDTIPVYRDAQECAELIRHYTERAVERRERAMAAHERVLPCSFENRAREIFLPRVEEVLGHGK